MTNLNKDLYQINSNQIEEIQKNIKYFFNKIECYFESKEMLFNDSKQISIEEILRNSPAHYSLIKMIEQFYILITKDRNWLKKFIAHYGIRFDWNTYQLWKSGKSYFTRKYDSTQCPSKWIIDIQEQMITLLQQIQLLLYLEFYTPEEDFKLFLKKNPVVDFNVKSNFVSKSFPSEKLDEIFKVIDFLLKISIESAIHTNYIIDTVKCMEAYRFIDESKITICLKRKNFSFVIESNFFV